MEWISGGSLASIFKARGPLNPASIRRYTQHILRALDFLHSIDILHSDVKGANVLLDEQKDVAKLADFDSAVPLMPSPWGKKLSCVYHGMTYGWASREALRMRPRGASADIWSLGCTVVEMQSGRPPWPPEYFIQGPLESGFEQDLEQQLKEHI
eukprot:RCo050689